MAPLRTWIRFTRPSTLLPPGLGVVSGAITAWGSAWNPDPARLLTWPVIWTVILGTICAGLLNAASNVINQIYDLEIDRANKPERPLITGAIAIPGAWRFATVLYVAAWCPPGWWWPIPPPIW